MQDAMTRVVDRWHDFYVLAGGTSMALRNDQISANNATIERDLWAIASIPLASLLDIVLLALAFLVPGQTALGLGLPLLCLAVLGSFQVLCLWVRSWSIPRPRVRRNLISILTRIGRAPATPLPYECDH